MRTHFKKGTGMAGLSLMLVGLGACSEGPSVTGGDDSEEVEVPEQYEFVSRFGDGSSVSYSGQVFRHVLISSLAEHLAGLTTRIDDGTLTPVEGDVVAELDFFYRFDGDTSGSLPIGMGGEMPLLEQTYNDISSGKDLQGKIAGNDEAGQHKDWTESLVGWDGAPSPDGLIQQWCGEIESMAIARANGDVPLGVGDTPIAAVHVSADGVDYRQLIQKFLLGSITFSQGTDDYLDDDTEDKGLLADNTVAAEGKPYTALEHAWDEGFGYFGAARDYLDYTDDEIAGKDGRDGYRDGYHDTSGDGRISLLSEFNFGHSLNAAKRDRGSSADNPTDFTGDAMRAFLTGRAIIVAADGALSDEQLDALREQRDIAVDNWELAIAATVVHYINDVLKDMETFETEDYDFLGHAKHWSELKGFALSLQFNPHSPLSEGDMAKFHEYVGMAPVLPGQEGIDEYRTALIKARGILGDAYGFAGSNLGDDQGAGGW